MYKGKIIPLVVSALKTLGKDNVNQEHIRRLQQILNESGGKRTLLNDANLAPAWIKKLILPIINNINE
jgi:hypothetical protein